MLFRNLVLFHLPENPLPDAAGLEALLSHRPLQACGPFDLQTQGFVTVGHAHRYLHSAGGQLLFAVGCNEKILPASVINDEARRRADAMESQQGHPPGRRQLRVIKAQVADELRARALTRQRTLHGWINPAAGFLAIDTASNARAEALVERLRDASGGPAALRWQSPRPVAETVASWLMAGEAPGEFMLDDELELQAPDNGALVRYQRHPLERREIEAHLRAGKLPTRIGLVWHDRIAFILHRDLRLTRIRLLDVYDEAVVQGEDAAEQFDLDFALRTGELTLLWQALTAVLGTGATAGTQHPASAAA